jgi:endonuclease/exonuclease/phosphatase family metal-dependent hydrolase
MKMNRILLTTITLVSVLVSLLCGCATDRQTPPVTLRVMSYNIHHGEGLDGKVDLLRIAQLIQEQGADIVGLQEVDKGVERTQRRDLPAELAALTGMTCVFSNNYYHQGGEYCNAVLTKFPVKRWTNLHYKMLRPGEQRGILQLVLDVRGRELVFLNTHIDYRPDDSERWSNTAEIEELARHYAGKPILMVGDFNDTPESRVCRRIAETFEDTWALVGQGEGFTIPAANPRKRIDYLWISKDKSLVPLKAWVPHSEASDHLPVMAEFQLK